LNTELYHKDDLRSLYCGDSRTMPQVESETVQCVVTSPPYWNQRKYEGEEMLIWGGDRDCPHVFDRAAGRNDFCPTCGAWRGVFGLEPTPQLYIEHSMIFLQEIWRVLRPDGVVFWNIADTYASGKGSCYNPGGGENSFGKTAKHAGAYPLERGNISDLRKAGLKPKDLCLVPERFVLEALKNGWYIRGDVIWFKTNHKPESVKDRPTKSHEYIYILTKSQRYHWDAEAIKEPSRRPGEVGHYGGRKYSNWEIPPDDPTYRNGHEQWHHDIKTNEMRNARSVWPISNETYKEAHFATFPVRLAEKCLLAGSRPGDLVLDPFAGSGTTLITATLLGRRSIGYEISRKYCALAIKRSGQMKF
jgi:DNA modification methylase